MAAVESWDDDDLQGDLFTHSVSTVQTSQSSRRSVSDAADEDWDFELPNDNASTNNAIASAKQAGVPIPHNIPPSALTGGTIKKLGKKASRPKLDEAWGEELDFPDDGGLTLKPKKLEISAASFQEDDKDDFDDLEGSLGIRFAGTKTDVRNRSSSASAMSPSLGSQTAESEDDDFRGLELPEGPMDLQAALTKRQQVEITKSPEPEVKVEQRKAQPSTTKSPKFLDENDDFFADLDIEGGDVFDTKKLSLHKNVKQKAGKSFTPLPTRTPLTSITFTADKPTATLTRIPRPVTAPKPSSRLEPVFETGAAQSAKTRLQPTTTSAQLLRSKRSMPVMRNNLPLYAKSSQPFLPAGASTAHSHHVSSKPTSHLRRDSDPYRAVSPQPRPFSRLSNAYVPDTPSRHSRRPDVASRELAREAAAKRTLTKPQRKRFFGDGSELEIFDDLPTSATKEAKFIKQPSTRAAPKNLRNIPSRLDLVNAGSKLPFPDRMITPLPPQTPRSPVKVFQETNNTPRYLRDTAASRIARESRLANTSSTNTVNSRPRSEGPLMPVTTNWKAQIVARSPHASPSAARNKGKRAQPGLIKPSDAPAVKGMSTLPFYYVFNADNHTDHKGMVFNPMTLRWEGNENSLHAFDFPPPLATPTQLHSHQNEPSSYMQARGPPSPPRPALIAPMSAGANQNIQVVGGMVFDPVKMCWLKFRPEHGSHASGPKSPSVTEDDDDPFAGIDDLKDNATSGGANAASSANGGNKSLGGLAGDEWLVGEEFDLGPEFIRRQKEEELAWRRRCEAWFANAQVEDGPRYDHPSWRWSIREIARLHI